MKKIFFDSFAYWALQPFKYRWLKKIENHRDNRNSNDQLADIFDEFVARYIVFSAAVGVLKPTSVKHKSDKEYCTTRVAKFLSVNKDNLVAELNNDAHQLGEIIGNGHLRLVSSPGKDPNLLQKWEATDNGEKLKAVLETLYYIRCNLFHGSKEFSSCQKTLLETANACLRIISDALFKQLDAEYLSIKNDTRMNK